MPDLIDMLKIRQIESSNDPSAVNPRTGAIGFYQIMPKGKRGALDEWNQFHPKQTYQDKDLYEPNINYNIANWYMNKRIPQMLKHYKIPDTLENRLASYNFGIGNVKSGKELPTETTNYIRKYLNETP